MIKEDIKYDLVSYDKVITSQLDHYQSECNRIEKKMILLIHEAIDPCPNLYPDQVKEAVNKAIAEQRDINEKIKNLKRMCTTANNENRFNETARAAGEFEFFWSRCKNEDKKLFLGSVFKKIIIANCRIIDIQYNEPYIEVIEE